MRDFDYVGQEFKRDEDEFRNARHRLRNNVLNRLSPYSKEDQEAWGII